MSAIRESERAEGVADGADHHVGATLTELAREGGVAGRLVQGSARDVVGADPHSARVDDPVGAAALGRRAVLVGAAVRHQRDEGRPEGAPERHEVVRVRRRGGLTVLPAHGGVDLADVRIGRRRVPEDDGVGARSRRRAVVLVRHPDDHELGVVVEEPAGGVPRRLRQAAGAPHALERQARGVEPRLLPRAAGPDLDVLLELEREGVDGRLIDRRLIERLVEVQDEIAAASRVGHEPSRGVLAVGREQAGRVGGVARGERVVLVEVPALRARRRRHGIRCGLQVELKQAGLAAGQSVSQAPLQVKPDAQSEFTLQLTGCGVPPWQQTNAPAAPLQVLLQVEPPVTGRFRYWAVDVMAMWKSIGSRLLATRWRLASCSLARNVVKLSLRLCCSPAIEPESSTTKRTSAVERLESVYRFVPGWIRQWPTGLKL